MEDPKKDIVPVIHTLTQAVPSKQKAAVEKFFTPTASFTHPFCATGSWELGIFGQKFTSRWAMLRIYQWYKILSPEINLEVENVTFNSEKLILYVDIHQHFKLFLVPFYNADVRLTTVLHLAQGDASGPSSVATRRFQNRYRTHSDKPFSYAAIADPKKDTQAVEKNGDESGKVYYITSQNDLYQTNEWIKFLVPWGIGSTLMVAWQLFATLQCVIGAIILFPFTFWKENSALEVPKKI